MSNFDLSKYETVKERKKRFYRDYPNGRIIVKLENKEHIEKYALVKCYIFRDDSKTVFSSGMAFELRETEKQLNKWGKEYEGVNYSSWLENCEESAVGRALDNAGYSGNDKCSKEEIEKAQRMNNISNVGQIDKDIQSEITRIGQAPEPTKGWQSFDMAKKISMLNWLKQQKENK
jgi:hypothetical protein